MKSFNELVKQWRSGDGLRAQLARGAVRGLLVTMAGVLVGFGVQVAVARILGVSEFGIYAWALAWINFLVMISCSGLDGLTVRRLPSYLIDGQWGKARGFLLFSIVWVGGVALFSACVLYGVAWLSRQHILPGSLNTLAICIWVTPLFALGAIRQAVLGALKHVAKAQILEAIVRPVFLLLIVVVSVFVLGMAATSAMSMMAQLIASAIVFVVGGLWVIRALPVEARRALPQREAATWLKEAAPFLAISGASAFSGQVGMLALGAVGTAADTGIYAAVLRITDIAMMGIYSIAAIASPLIVEVVKKQDQAGLAQVMKWGARGSLAFAVLAGGGVLLFGDWILAAFGKAFLGGHDPLYIMLPGVMVSAFAGMSGVLLAMSGHAGVRAAIGWFSALCNFTICIIAAPKYGIYGAALGYTVASVVGSSLCLYFCWRYHRLWVGLR